MKSGAVSFISTAVAMLSAWVGIGRRNRPRPLPFRPLRSRLMVAGALFLGINCGLAPVARAKTPAPDDKWRIVCIRNAISDGVIVFRLTPVGGQALELKVPIKDGAYDNAIAHEIQDVFRANLSKELYHVEVDDGEAVLVKRKRGQPKFLLEFVSNNVNGLGIRVELD